LVSSKIATSVKVPPTSAATRISDLSGTCMSAASRIVADRIGQHADAFDFDFAEVAVAHEDRRLAGETDAGRRAGDDDVADLERHRLADAGDQFGHRKQHVV